jgi:hypothetical protein
MLLRITKRFDLRVWQASPMMPAAPDDLPVLYEHRANHRVWRRRAITAPGEAQRQAHELCIVHARSVASFARNRLSES